MNKLKNLFKNKIVFILSIVVISAIILYLVGYYTLFLSMKIKGNSNIEINYDEEYIDSGATVKILNKDLTNKIIINSNVRQNKVGNYRIVYTFKYLIYNIKKIRYVNIIDNEAPIITLKGENKVNICPNSEYIESGYEAIDNYDGDITDKVVIINYDGGIYYEVSDSSGNKEKVVREIIKEDIESPVLKLKGSKKVYVRTGAKYHESGYEVTDNCDADINVEVNSNVDTTKDGDYIVTYEAVDSSGNKTTIERNVVIYTDNRIGIVYLTFDDGPSATGSTEKILNVLKEEDIKATFFVTGKGPDNLIKREYDEGHTVALHTNTHDYDILYKNVDAYYNDLNAVKNRVYNITGENVNIIRFPGGSNNTVSITASGYKIMDYLTQDVLDKGYIYFDWNVSSGDAGGCTSSSCVYNNVVNGLSKSRINMVLMHDIKMFTANAIKDIITYCKENGYVFDVITESTQQVRFK